MEYGVLFWERDGCDDYGVTELRSTPYSRTPNYVT